MDWLVRQLFKIKPLRIALFEEVELYNSITRIMADDESSKIACALCLNIILILLYVYLRNMYGKMQEHVHLQERPIRCAQDAL